MPFLLQSLSDSSDGVVLLTVQVLSRITLSQRPASERGSREKSNEKDVALDDTQFLLVIKIQLGSLALNLTVIKYLWKYKFTVSIK